jgi:hypothetical protein
VTPLYETETLAVHACPSCGVLHAIPESLEKRALGDRGPNGRQIYCPNGHTWHFTGKTAAQEAREEAEHLRQRLASEQENVRAARAHAEVERRSAAAFKGHVTRLKNRVGKGKCPCCSTEFPNIAAHMAEAHPGYGEDDA